VSARRKVAVLISGRGSNMAALIEAARVPDYPAEIALVLSNRPDAQGIARAMAAGVPTVVVDHRPFGKDREAFEREVQTELTRHAVELVCLAGFMRIFTPSFMAKWQGRMLNIHPSLLPDFPGLNPHAQALAAGVKEHGCTVHFATTDLDAGPVVAQAKVPVLPGDTEATLAERVLAQEHVLYPAALRLVAAGRAALDGNRVVFKDAHAGAV
jgi:phosphoribosylglycinamide formyltransferase-1